MPVDFFADFTLTHVPVADDVTLRVRMPGQARRSSCCTATRAHTPRGIAAPRLVEAGHTVVCPDLRGYGGSTPCGSS